MSTSPFILQATADSLQDPYVIQAMLGWMTGFATVRISAKGHEDVVGTLADVTIHEDATDEQDQAIATVLTEDDVVVKVPLLRPYTVVTYL